MDVEDAIWSLPKFPFVVSGIPGNPNFLEASGLQPEEKVIPYRIGDMPAMIPMPGLKGGVVTLRTGIFRVDAALWKWFDSIKRPMAARSTISIGLLDDTGAARMIWTLDGAVPRMVAGILPTPDCKEVAVRSLELAYTTLSMAAG